MAFRDIICRKTMLSCCLLLLLVAVVSGAGTTCPAAVVHVQPGEQHFGDYLKEQGDVVGSAFFPSTTACKLVKTTTNSEAATFIPTGKFEYLFVIPVDVVAPIAVDIAVMCPSTNDPAEMETFCSGGSILFTTAAPTPIPTPAPPIVTTCPHVNVDVKPLQQFPSAYDGGIECPAGTSPQLSLVSKPDNGGTFLPTGDTSFFFIAPSNYEITTTMEVSVACGRVSCTGGRITFYTGPVPTPVPTPAPTLPQCAPETKNVFNGQQLDATYTGGLSPQDCAAPQLTIEEQPAAGALLLVGGAKYIFAAPDTSSTASAVFSVSCDGSDGKKGCIGGRVSFVSSPAPTPEPTPVPPTPVPETPVPPTPEPVPLCPASVVKVTPHEQYFGAYSNDLVCSSGSPATLALAVDHPQNGKEWHFLPTGGNGYLFIAPAAGDVTVTVVAKCDRSDAQVDSSCTGTVTFVIPTPPPTPQPTTAEPTPAPPTPAPIPVPIPMCSGVQTTFTVEAGEQLSATYDAGMTSKSCVLAGRVTQAPATSALLFLGGLDFVFSASAPGEAVVQIDVMCDATIACQAALVFTVAAPPTPQPTTAAPTFAPPPQCTQTRQMFEVVAGVQFEGDVAVPEVAGCPSGSWAFDVSESADNGAILFTNANHFIFATFDTFAGSAKASVVAACGSYRCEIKLGFFIAKNPAVTDVPETTPAPPTPTPTAAGGKVQCATGFAYSVPSATSLRGDLEIEKIIQSATPASVANPDTFDKSKCHPLIRPQANGAQRHEAVNTSFKTNIIGNFLFENLDKVNKKRQFVDSYKVDVLCMNTFVCEATVRFTVYAPIAEGPEPTAAITGAPQPTSSSGTMCPNVYYYAAIPDEPHSNTLRDRPGEPTCSVHRTFELLRPVSIGTLSVMTLRGDFSFSVPNKDVNSTETKVANFGFAMYCHGKLLCEGNAYIMITKDLETPAPATPAPTAPPSTQAPPTPVPTFANSDSLKCQGTCNEKAWKAQMQFPDVWDNTLDENGHTAHLSNPLDFGIGTELGIAHDGSLIITSHSTIGNVAARFPTFEPFTFEFGDKFTAELNDRIASTSTGFDQKCLSLQSASGWAEEVWVPTNKSTKAGHVGSHYNSGSSWFQKFGGKHIECDTFANACRYAPLLTPNSMVDAFGDKKGTWQVAVSDCDVTWTGTFPYTSLRELTFRNGSSIFKFNSPRELSATIYSEAVKPNNWLESARGYASKVSAYPINLDLAERVVALKKDPKKDATPFTLDVEFFEYRDNKTSDRAFGLNMLVFPHVENGAKSSYAPDRHVMGFTWKHMNWEAPNKLQCPGCTGHRTNCTAFHRRIEHDDFMAEAFPTNACGQHSRIVLSKGPKTDTQDCPGLRTAAEEEAPMTAAASASAKMHVFNRAGFSPTKNCRSSYQNLTIRGVAPGSHSSTSNAFSFEGKIEVQLLLDDGSRPSFIVDLSMFISRMTISSAIANVAAAPPVANGRKGHMDICRSSPYWPVLDPLGTSLPDEPHPLSKKNGEGEEEGTAGKHGGSLCVDRLDRSFGPTGWALLTVSMDGEDTPNEEASSYELTSLTLNYEGLKAPVVLVAPKNGEDKDAFNPHLWCNTHPFLNFRDLTHRLEEGQRLTTADDVTPFSTEHPPTFAFALTPGAIHKHTTVEITAEVAIQRGGPDQQPTQVTLRQFITVDPLLTAESRYGPPQLANEVELVHDDSNLTTLVVAGIVVVAVIVAAMSFMADDSDGRPLPKWMPRSKVLKKTLFKDVHHHHHHHEQQDANAVHVENSEQEGDAEMKAVA